MDRPPEEHLQTYELVILGPQDPWPRHVQEAQRTMLLYLSSGYDLAIATAVAVGLDPALDLTPSLEKRCLLLGSRWLQDPQIEEMTAQFQRVATASMRL